MVRRGRNRSLNQERNPDLMWDDEIFDEACRAYERYHKRNRHLYFAWPGRYSSEMDEMRVYLGNVNGALARYNYHTKRLSHLKKDNERFWS